jgi:hypothetical protein
MKRRVLTIAIALAASLVIGRTAVDASFTPRWTGMQLATFANAIITGRVVDIRVGTDPVTNGIYTYVTVDVIRVIKGRITTPHVVIKQLGGVLPPRALRIPGQSEFVVGEEVLLFLEIRPRDGSLYTAAFWQGKWNISRVGEIATAWRREPMSSAVTQWALDAVLDMARTVAGDSRAAVAPNLAPADAAAAGGRPYVLMNWRFITSPMVVDVQTGGQSGLAGGGVSEIQSAIDLWNGGGSAFRFAMGSQSGPARCYKNELHNGKVTITFNDPCGEVQNSGLTLAFGGAWSSTTEKVSVNGTDFYVASEGFVVNNDSPAALNLLRQSGCFRDIQLHELGHVLGLDHSTDLNAIMYPTINNSCSIVPHGLGTDDINGLRFIYPPSTSGPPSFAPSGVAVTVNGFANIVVSFNPVTADVRYGEASATGYRLDFRQSPGGPVLVSMPTSSATTTIPIPGGVVGTFYVSVTASNAAGFGPTSSPVAFAIPGSCGLLSAPTGLSGNFNAAIGVASASWISVPGATSYVVEAGTVAGAANLFNANIGNTTAASAAGLPHGFRAFVRVRTVNGCGAAGPASADVLIQ